ncbi:nucleotidyltransferase domain-containing protein [Halorhodospira halochloris]|uniref:nucleotidyltransferase domain-containing protein n=1 Tax=Halorhodospira halochloris TaxID=1052 RepID=UPI001EE7A24D|nr:nucleotidyltransferase domain-containing protein [Halorhodospira halochloris]MCG5549478.1 nucleotidyltransferase domain-containing protein [Halorhodospira halochloris]
MRLTPAEQATIRSVCRSHLPANLIWRLRVFGSCLDEQARGGDVDLYLEIEGADATQRTAVARDLRPSLEEALDRPVDLVVQDPAQPFKTVSALAREQGILIATSSAPKELQRALDSRTDRCHSSSY